MKDLLSSITKRRMEIFEVLYKEKNWISSNELALKTDVSLRTINSDIHYLKERWAPYLVIETSKKNGVRLTTPPSSQAQLIFHNGLKKSEAYQFLEHIFFEPEYNFEHWIDELFTSESSLYRTTHQINRSLRNYGIFVQKRPCFLQGKNERNVRFFYAIYFKEAYGFFDWPFEFERNNIVLFVEDFLQQDALKVDDEHKLFLTYLTAVTLTRISQGFIYSGSNDLEPVSASNDFYRYSHHLEPAANELNLVINNDTKNELIRSLLIFQSSEVFEKQNQTVFVEIKRFLETIQRLFNIELTESVQEKIIFIFIYIYQFYKIYPHQNYILFNSKEYSGITIKENYPTFFKIVTDGLIKMEKKTGFPWNSIFCDEITCWLIVKWPNLTNAIEDKKRKVLLLVISSIGPDHAEVLMNQLYRNFSTKVVVQYHDQSIFTLSDESSSEFTPYDYIISTFNSNFLPQEKLIVVDEVPSNNVWGNIRRAINNVHKISSTILAESGENT